jgi:hypothetical protein
MTCFFLVIILISLLVLVLAIESIQNVQAVRIEVQKHARKIKR